MDRDARNIRQGGAMPTGLNLRFWRHLAVVLAMFLGLAWAIGSVGSLAPTTARSEPRQAPTASPTPSGYELVERSRFAAGGTHALAMYGDYVVMGVDSELRVVDVVIPNQPAIAGRLELGGTVGDLTIDGRMAYVIAYASPLVIIDLEDPRQPRIVGRVEMRAGRSLAVAGGFLYVEDFGVLRVFDARDPRQVVLIAEVPYPVGSYAWDLDWAAGYVYICTAATLYIFDVRDPSKPALVNNIDRPTDRTNFSGMAIRDGLAYVGAQTAGLIVFDISTPDKPTLIATMPPPKSGSPSYQEPLIVDNSTLAVPAYSGGIDLVDIANPRQPATVGHLSTPTDTWKVVGGNGSLFAAVPDLGLLVVDVSNPSAPVQVAAIEDPAPVFDFALADPWVYVQANAGRVRIFNIADRAHPREVSRLTIPHVGTSVASWRGALYICGADSTLTVVDVQNPSDPKTAVELKLRDPCDTLLVWDQRLYVGGENGLVVLDASNPLSPVVLGSFREIGLGALATDGLFLYAVGDVRPNAGLVVLDVRDPSRIAVAGQLDLADLWPSGIALTENTVGLTGQKGFRLVDVSDPTSPRALPAASAIPSRVFTDHYSYRPIGSADDLVYVARWSSSLASSLRVLDLFHRDQPALLVDFDLKGSEANLVKVQGDLVALGMYYRGVTLYEQSYDRPDHPTEVPLPTATPTAKSRRAYLPAARRHR